LRPDRPSVEDDAVVRQRDGIDPITAPEVATGHSRRDPVVAIVHIPDDHSL